MGLKSEIVRLVLHHFAPGCKKKGVVSLPEMASYYDVLNYMYHAPGPRSDGTFTGMEAYALFAEPIREFEKNNEAVLVVITDDQNHVPRQKYAEQFKRHGSKEDRIEGVKEKHPEFVPYEPNCTFTDEGIVRVGVDGEPCKPERMILSECLVGSGKLRIKLMHYFATVMAQNLMLPAGKTIRFIFDGSTGSVLIGSNLGPQWMGWDHIGHGEYDRTAPHIASREYRNRPNKFITTDGDTLPVMVAMLSKYTFDQPVYWVNERGTYIDCREMVPSILRNTGLSARRFVDWCILGGADYIDSMVYSRGFNDGAMLAVLKHDHCEKVLLTLDETKEVKTTEDSDDAAIETIVRWLHTIRLEPSIQEAKKDKTSQKRKETKAKKASAKTKPLPDWSQATEADYMMEEDYAGTKAESTQMVVDVFDAEMKRKRKSPEGGEESKEEDQLQNGTVVAKVKRTVSCGALEISASGQLAIQRNVEEYELVTKHIGRIKEPKPLEECTQGVNSRYYIPTKAERVASMQALLYCRWNWLLSWDLPVMITYERWLAQEKAKLIQSSK